ncbi:hypothetical protein ACP4OV_023204 [Aristida adscensionis]
MALWKAAALLVAAVLASASAAPPPAAVLASAAAGCGRKVLVQNLCGRPLVLRSSVRSNSPPLFPDGRPERTLPAGQHEEFPVCTWHGVLAVDGAPAAEFHVGTDGAWYKAPNAAPGLLPMSITPHTARGALQGHCPAVGCRKAECFKHDEAGGNCTNADEIKIIYCQP